MPISAKKDNEINIVLMYSVYDDRLLLYFYLKLTYYHFKCAAPKLKLAKVEGVYK